MNKKALITGINGQDGAYLSKLLLEKGYEVYGSFRKTSSTSFQRLKSLKVDKKINFIPLELHELNNIYRTIERYQFDEIYNLGAQSYVSLSFDEPIFTADITGIGPLRLLEAIKEINKDIKFYQASSSEMFGKTQTIPLNEDTPFRPRSPYAISKLFAHWITVTYKESYGLFACSGILFNHESPLRGLDYVTRKISYGIAKIKHGLQKTLLLGNLASKRDWGYAPEYVKAMWLMLQQSKPEDFVIATGKTHSVREVVELAFKKIDIDIEWQGHGVNEKGIDTKTGTIVAEISPEFFRPSDIDTVQGDSSKAKKILGWQPETNFEDLIGIMVEEDIKRVRKEMLFCSSNLEQLF